MLVFNNIDPDFSVTIPLQRDCCNDAITVTLEEENNGPLVNFSMSPVIVPPFQTYIPLTVQAINQPIGTGLYTLRFSVQGCSTTTYFEIPVAILTSGMAACNQIFDFCGGSFHVVPSGETLVIGTNRQYIVSGVFTVEPGGAVDFTQPGAALVLLP